MSIERRIAELGLELPGPRERKGEYLPAVRVGNLLYTSGQDTSVKGQFLHAGKLGAEFDVAQGQELARHCVVNALQVVKDHGGGLDNVRRVIKVLGFVSSVPGFNQQPAVIDGASRLLHEIFGEAGRHARSAIGTNELPLNIPVEIEFIFELAE